MDDLPAITMEYDPQEGHRWTCEECADVGPWTAVERAAVMAGLAHRCDDGQPGGVR